MEVKKPRKQTAVQKLNNFLRSDLAKTFPLTHTHILILFSLASFTYYNHLCDPSFKSITDFTRIKDKRTLIKGLLDLQAFGFIKILKKNGCRSTYLWCVPEIKDEEVYSAKPVNKRRISEKPVALDATGNQVH